MSPFGTGHCADKTRLSRFCSPLPLLKKIAVLSSKYLQRNRTNKETFSSSLHHPPNSFFLSSSRSLNNLALFWAHSCGPFSFSPLCRAEDGGPGEHRPTFRPSTALGRGWGDGGLNQAYLSLLRHQLDTWAERQRLFRKSPGCWVTHPPTC